MPGKKEAADKKGAPECRVSGKKGAPEKLTARVFELRYGAMVREEYVNLSPRMLAKALAARSPQIKVSEGVLRVWLDKFNLPEGAVAISTRHELSEKYGEVVAAMATEHGSGYRLQQALKKRDPPVYVTLGAAMGWFVERAEAVKGGGRKRGREENDDRI